MALLDFLRNPQAQAPGSMSQPRGLGALLDPALGFAMAGQLMGNQGNAANFGNAMTVGGLALGQQRELRAQTEKENKTRTWLMNKHGMSQEEADSIIAAGEAGQWMKPPVGNDGASVYGTPIYGTDPETNQTVLGVIGKDGSFQKLDTGGVQVTPGVQWQDFGTYRQPFNSKNAQPAGPQVPIDNAGAARDTAAGKDQGTALATYRSMVSKMPGLEFTIQQLDGLADTATYTLGGQALDAGMKQLGMDPRQAAVDRTKYIAMVDNQVLPMLRDTFGAQFTVAEGESLRATLGDPNKSPKEKQAVLKAFIEQKRRDIEALALQTGQPGGEMPQGGVVDYTDFF